MGTSGCGKSTLLNTMMRGCNCPCVVGIDRGGDSRMERRKNREDWDKLNGKLSGSSG